MPFTIAKAEVFVFRAPIDNPVRTSFGVMYNRPSVLLRIEDSEGAEGWGEAWCNFPSCGAEHRGRLLETVMIPLLLGKNFDTAEEVFDYLTKKTHILALQTNEPGPMAQAIAAVDLAVWDLVATKQGIPLYKALGEKGSPSMPAYASGINPVNTVALVEQARADGYRSFKFKIGFDLEHDLKNLEDVTAILQPHESLAVDVNQAWDLPFALDAVAKMWDFPLAWLEEPLPCDTHYSQWEILRKYCPIPLAAGENIKSSQGFFEAIARDNIAVFQPDICKWGGLSKNLPITQAILDAGKRYCPHYLGGGIGLIASAHLLAAVGGDGSLEIDNNPNPLRELLADPYPQLIDGNFTLSDAPGLGVKPLMAEVKDFISYYKELSI